MRICKLFMGAFIALFGSAAFASFTPSYTGNTLSATALIPPSTGVAPGYYLWNEASNSSNWHLRWTAPGVDAPGDKVDWYGYIVFQNSSLGSVDTFRFEASSAYYGDTQTTYYDFFGGDDFIVFDAATNDTGGVDGLKFTVNSDVEILEFNLSSSLWTMPGPSGVYASQDIFIGDGFNTNFSTAWDDNNGSGRVFQQFEINVPEPGTIVLFFLGLVGLSFCRRKI